MSVMKVSTGQVVTIDFELAVKGGETVESSQKTGPVSYTHGEKKLLPFLEKRIEGMGVGEERRGEVPAAEIEQTLPTRELPRSEFPKDAKLEVGTIFQARSPTGDPVSFKVVSASKDKVTVRFLLPFSGKDLSYRVKVLVIDDPKAKKKEAWVPPPPAAALKVNPDDLEDG